MSGSHMKLEDWLDDLCVRFIINLPQEDLSSVARICFQVEEAQWFYEDFIRPLDPTLPSMTLRTFCLRMFQHCPLLASFSVETSTRAFEEFLQYKTRIPVRGAIMLNHAMDATVLVKGWKKGANWSFPRGKINKDEDDLDCAVREVWEETGLDLKAAGLMPTEAKPKYIEINMREQQLRLYVFKNIPMDTDFAPQTRKEISKIQWYKLSELPAFRRKGGADENGQANNANKFYMVAPFLVPLKKWVQSQKKQEARRNAPQPGALPQGEDIATEDDAWHNFEQPVPQGMAGLAKGTLENATNELQRLLKVQPATQGVQPGTSAAEVNKGTALLSILQAKQPQAPPPEQSPLHSQQNHLPQTPMGQVYTQPPMPSNPHHHNNQTRMPSHASQSVTAGPENVRASAPHMNTGGPTQVTSDFGGPQQQRYPSFNHQSQQRQSAGHAGQHMSHQSLPPQNQPGSFSGAAAGQALPGPPVQILSRKPPMDTRPQLQPSQPSAGSRPLNDQSMALLNAFKGAPAPTTTSHEPSRQAPPANPVSGSQTFSPPASIPAPHLYVPQAPRQAVPSTSPQELAGIGPVPQGPRQTEHQSALLGMFKSAASPSVQPAPPAQPSAFGSEQARTEQTMASALNRMSFHDNRSHAVQGQTPRTHQPEPSQQSPQTPRILKRGQDINSLNAPSGMPQSHMSPSLAPARQSPVAKSPQQKQQLLSLFGKSAGSPLANVTPHAAPAPMPDEQAHVRSRVGSLAPSVSSPSRRGSQTPISPADQNFLLGYLQSVTNNASAR